MSAKSDIRARLISLVRDDPESGKLNDPDDYDLNIAHALSRHSRYRPDKKVEDITGNGTADYDISSLTAWVDGFSRVERVEFPIDDVPETLLENDGFNIYEKPAGKVLRLTALTPEASEEFRVTYTIPVTVNTLAANDTDALCSLAASICCEQLANAYAQTSDSTVNADSVNYRTKSQEFAARAKRMLKLYTDHLGIKEGDSTVPASVVVDLDMKYPGGGERLTHPRSGRESR